MEGSWGVGCANWLDCVVEDCNKGSATWRVGGGKQLDCEVERSATDAGSKCEAEEGTVGTVIGAGSCAKAPEVPGGS